MKLTARTRKRTEKMRKTTGRGRRRDRSVMPPTLRYRSTSDSTSRNVHRVTTRMRMRPWLEDLLNSEACSILRWVDRSKKTFSIAWRHASSHGFDPSQHGDLFYRWAVHTGKLKKNSHIDHTSNKSNFRCALHSLKDCIELTAKGDKRGEGAKRTYQFIDPGHRLYDTKRKREGQRRKKNHMVQLSCCSPCQSHVVQLKVEAPDYLQDPGDHSPQGIDSLDVTSTVPDIFSPSHSSPDHLSSSLDNSVQTSTIPSSSAVMETPYRGHFSPPLTSANGHLQGVPKFDLLTPSSSRNTRLITETQPDGVIALTLQPSNSVENSVIRFKEEPSSAESLPKFNALGIKDTYDASPICHPKLSCGGNVIIQKHKPEKLSHPEFLINYSLPPNQLTVTSPEMEDDYHDDTISLSYPTEDMELFVSDDINMDNLFPQNDANGQRVLTILQPFMTDETYAAIEVSHSEDISNFLTPDVSE